MAWMSQLDDLWMQRAHLLVINSKPFTRYPTNAIIQNSNQMSWLRVAQKMWFVIKLICNHVSISKFAHIELKLEMKWGAQKKWEHTAWNGNDNKKVPKSAILLLYFISLNSYVRNIVHNIYTYMIYMLLHVYLCIYSRMYRHQYKISNNMQSYL